MNRDEAKEIAKTKLREYYEEIRDKKGACPICGGGHKTACFSIDPKKGNESWKCFSCEKGGDIFDLYAEVNHLQMKEAMEAVYKKYGISFTDTPHTHTHNIHTTYTQYTHKGKPIQEEYKMEQRRATLEEKIEANEFISKAQKALEGSAGEEYLKGRGFSLSEMKAFRLGYYVDEDGVERVVIPRENLWVARAIKDGVEPKYKVPIEEIKELYNTKALEGGIDGFNRFPIYIVRGEFDAMSITVAGGKAVALSIIGNKRRFVDYVRKVKEEFEDSWTPIFILALANNSRAKLSTVSLKAELKELGLEVYEEDTEKLYGGYKDANEALIYDRKGFTDRLVNTEEKFMALPQRMENQYREEGSNSGYMKQFEDYILQARTAIPTGFPRLDMLLSGDEKSEDKGGLSEGLYVLGAPSSCGKTTFVLQMCDNIAESGRDVLFFSLEMSRFELMSKSVSRLTYRLEQEDEYKDLRNECVKKFGKYRKGMGAKTNYGILRGARSSQYSELEKKLIAASKKEYEEKIAPHIFIIEGAPEGTSVQKIREKVAEHIERTGDEPVVVIDYLQMIAPPKDLERATDKQVVDYNIRELKVASRTHKIPLIAISSYSRANYTAESSLSSFKESGSIEYSADIVIALSYANLKTAEKGAKNEGEVKADMKSLGMRKRRNIKLEVLKNRNGAKGYIYYEYAALFNYFDEYRKQEGDMLRRLDEPEEEEE